MWKKVNLGLNIVMGSSFGVWLGYALWTLFDFRSHPEAYANTALPWYTGLLVRGAVLICILLLGFTVKLFAAILRWRREKDTP